MPGRNMETRTTGEDTEANSEAAISANTPSKEEKND
jgi:hypothetical protein